MLSKSQAQQLLRLMENQDFQLYQEILTSLRNEAERRVWSNPDNATNDIVIRNTLNMVINHPQTIVDQLREKLKID